MNDCIEILANDIFSRRDRSPIRRDMDGAPRRGKQWLLLIIIPCILELTKKDFGILQGIEIFQEKMF